MVTGVWHHAGHYFFESKFGDSTKTLGGSHGGNDPTDQPVQVVKSGRLYSKVSAAHIEDSLVFKQEHNVRGLHGGMSSQD